MYPTMIGDSAHMELYFTQASSCQCIGGKLHIRCGTVVFFQDKLSVYFLNNKTLGPLVSTTVIPFNSILYNLISLPLHCVVVLDNHLELSEKYNLQQLH